MIVQIAFKYSVNLDRILYTEMDSDTDEMKIIFDNGSVLLLKGRKEIDDFDKNTRHNDLESQT